MPLKAIEPRRLYRQIAEQLRELIDCGEYQAGSRLPTERELAGKLGVSRPTVREALIALEVQGRIRIRVGSGIYVSARQRTVLVPDAPAREGPLEVLSARALVESAIAEEAARKATDDDVARLEAILKRVERGPVTRKIWVGLDREFHVAVVATLDNALLVRAVGDLFDQRINPYFERLSGLTENASAWKAAHQEHRAIRDAIAARDPVRSGAAMRSHLERSHQRFSREFGEPPFTDCEPAAQLAQAPTSLRRPRTKPENARKELAG